MSANISKVRQPRFWKKWKQSGAVFIWPHNPIVNGVIGEQLMDVAKHLIAVCKITKWLNGTEMDTYIHFPIEYRFKGIKIKFLPHWANIEIDGKLVRLVETNPVQVLKNYLGNLTGPK